MSLYRCARIDQLDDIDVISEISEANRLLERKFPDCTIQRVAIDNGEQGSLWVAVDLEVTAQSLACEEWYRIEMARRKILVLDMRPKAFD